MLFLSGILMGIVGSLHCVGMCGPIVLAMNYRQKGFLKNFFYHFGRLFTYAALGLTFGLAGMGIALSGVQQGLSIAMGLLILLFAIWPTLKSNSLQQKWQIKVLSPMKRRLLQTVNKGSYFTVFSLGVLNGLLPCGMVYMALATALVTASPADAMLVMAGFGVGTWPLMLALATGGGWLAQHFRKQLNYAIPVVAVMVGTLLILRGLALDIPYISPVLTSLGLDSGITVCN